MTGTGVDIEQKKSYGIGGAGNIRKFRLVLSRRRRLGGLAKGC